MCRERLATADRRDFFKSMFSSDECAELLSACQIYPGVEDDRYPLDRNVLIKEIEAVRTVRDSQSTPSEEDQTTFTPGYILHNLPAVAMLLVRSVVQDADNWVRGLVGGSLSYSSLDLAWFWVLAFSNTPALTTHRQQTRVQADGLPLATWTRRGRQVSRNNGSTGRRYRPWKP